MEITEITIELDAEQLAQIRRFNALTVSDEQSLEHCREWTALNNHIDAFAGFKLTCAVARADRKSMHQAATA